MSTSPPKGTFDVTPLNGETWKDSSIWQLIQKKMLETCRLFGLSEIKTPIFEKIELFRRSVGDVSDIVTKEMYEFQDKGGRDLALRPEGTASCVRALINDRTYEKLSVARVFYFGPQFRYERGQKGRYRQHYQFGVELVGSEDPFFDAEGIEILWHFYKSLGLQNITLHLNSIGDTESRDLYRKKLIDYLTPYKNDLSEDSQKRLEKNPLRILDSKDQQDQALLVEAPKILDCLNSPSNARFDKVQEALQETKIPFLLDSKLVRGLDYYNQTVFEIKSSDLGAQDTLGAGGRYDSLFQTLGGPDTPAFGFATGLERIIHTLLAQNPHLKIQNEVDLMLFPLDEKALTACQKLARDLRAQNISCVIDARNKKIANAINYAVKLKTTYFIAVGDKEMQTKLVLIKTLDTKQEKQIQTNQIATFIHENNE